MEVPETAGKRVLIVEDNPLNMKLFSAMVEAQGHLVLQATDGRRGLDLAQQQHPDLIILDVNLPGMSGLEVTQHLKDDDQTRDIPVIVTTACGLPEDEELRASRCDALMAKPITVGDFVALVQSLAARSTGGPRRPAPAGRSAVGSRPAAEAQ